MRITSSLVLVLALAFEDSGSRLTAADSDGPVPVSQAASKMTVPKGFKVTLFAGEPDVVQPIAFTFDDRGRMWVVECLSYPKWTRDGTGHDRVVILEDTDGDGTFDKKTVFMDNGANLSGIELGFGGVWLCSSPNLLFVPILEGDKLGKPEVKLDGWNMIDTKHNIFNSLGWGPDGWLYGLNGIQAKAWVGEPGTPKEKRKYIDCGVWRYHPTRKVFEPVAHGTTNPFGLDWDEYGEMFITNCVIDHLFHIVPGGHYERMYGQDANPHVYGLMKSCVDYKHWAGGDWTSSRSTGVGGDPRHSDAGGGHAHAGCAIYLGDNFPAEYRNTLFTANIHGNRLNNDGLERTKSGYKGVRRPDFLFANDSWFRGICVKVGPEGALYVSDWCDTGECHNYDKADTTNGRIYRVTYGDPNPWKGDVSKFSDAELVKAQTSKNEWFVRHARRVLQERAVAGKLEKGTKDGLRALLKDEKDASRRLRALWALSVVGGVDYTQLITEYLRDPEELVRSWAARLMIEGYPELALPPNSGAQKLEAYRSQMIEAIMDRLKTQESPHVQVAIASALQRADKGVARELLKVWLPLLSSSSDPELLQMVWYAMLRFPVVEELGLPREEMPPLLRCNTLRFMLTGSPFPVKGNLASVLTLLYLAKTRDAQMDVLLVIRETFAGTNPPDIEPVYWQQAYEKLLKEGDPAIVRQAEAVAVIFGDEKVIADLVKRAGDVTAKSEDRRLAIELLLTRKQPNFAKTLLPLLDDLAVRQAAVRGLAAYANVETPAAILKAYPKFTTEEKLDAVNTLASRAAWAKQLLDAIEKKDIPRSDVPVTAARQILALNDRATTARLEQVWGKIAPASKERAALIKKWKAILTEETIARADAGRGRAVFAKNCASCHKMFGEGEAFAPELTGSQRANLDYVLENVLDPSAVVPNEFRLINFTTADDRVVSGTILRETRDAVTVRTARETVVLPVADIASRTQTNLSIMPDGLFDQMKPDDIRDLVAYLRSKEQVPIKAQ